MCIRDRLTSWPSCPCHPSACRRPPPSTTTSGRRDSGRVRPKNSLRVRPTFPQCLVGLAAAVAPKEQRKSTRP
eukprot:12692147-Alexandrium_andersonii.AAC.1